MHTKSDNVKTMNGTDAINELIDSFMKRYQEGLETKMKRSSYIFERIDLSPEWIKKRGNNKS